jgi:hypothetical protein
MWRPDTGAPYREKHEPRDVAAEQSVRDQRHAPITEDQFPMRTSPCSSDVLALIRRELLLVIRSEQPDRDRPGAIASDLMPLLRAKAARGARRHGQASWSSRACDQPFSQSR